MGLISTLFGGLFGGGAKDLARVFVADRSEAQAQEHAENIKALEQLAAEFGRAPRGWFDGLVDGLNRLPRPAMAMGTLALFGFAMWDPVAFGIRMQGLALVPEPLWWLLGAIVSFYFGARELHHWRSGGPLPGTVAATVENMRAIESLRPAPEPDPVEVPLPPEPDDALPEPAAPGALAPDPAAAPAAPAAAPAPVVVRDGIAVPEAARRMAAENPAIRDWIATL